MGIKKTTYQYAEEKRWVFSFDLKEQSEDGCLTEKKQRTYCPSLHHLIATDSELEAVRALFNEKEKELAVAVSKVDQLMRQLQDLKDVKASGVIANSNTAKGNSNAMTLELEKLRNELLVSTDKKTGFESTCCLLYTSDAADER